MGPRRREPGWLALAVEASQFEEPARSELAKRVWSRQGREGTEESEESALGQLESRVQRWPEPERLLEGLARRGREGWGVSANSTWEFPERA